MRYLYEYLNKIISFNYPADPAGPIKLLRKREEKKYFSLSSFNYFGTLLYCNIKYCAIFCVDIFGTY